MSKRPRSSRLRAFIRLGRPHFLVGGILFHALGALLAWRTGSPVNGAALLWGQVAITAIQFMTQYANEYFDQAADRANLTPTPWSGGSRVLVDGRLPAWAALVSALGLAGTAVFAVAALVVTAAPGPLTTPLFGLALLLAWSYSAPPLRLHGRGLGAPTVGLLVPGLTTLVGYYLQAGRLDWLPALAAWPLIWLQMGMILAIDFPDAAGDAVAGKRTPVVRWGPRRAVDLHTAALLGAYLSLPLLVAAGLLVPVAGAVAVGAPLALWQVARLRRGAWADPARWNSLGFWSVALLIGTAMLAIVALAVLLVSETTTVHS